MTWQWPTWVQQPEWVLGPASGLVISLWYGWAQWNRFERLQAELFAFFRQELEDSHQRYNALLRSVLQPRRVTPPPSEAGPFMPSRHPLSQDAHSPR
ncbi:MAG: hypothetical protein U0003_02930 [Vampirovibrionales bacterium]